MDGLRNDNYEFGHEFGPYGPGTPAWETCEHLACAVRLLIQGGQEELTSRHAVPQPRTSIIVLGTIVREIDDHLDLPTGVLDDFMRALETALKN